MTSIDERYGSSGRSSSASSNSSANRAAIWVAALVLLLVVAIWVSQLIAGGAHTSTVSSDTVRVQVVSDSRVDYDFRVTAPPGTPLVCALEARDRLESVVGWNVVEVPPSVAPSQVVHAEIRTVGLTSTVIVKQCWTPQ